MKLKKIASLMLAGVMAVSMLAGCSGNSNNNSNSNNNQNENTNTSSMVAAVNDAQDKIDFTAGASITDALTKVAEVYGTQNALTAGQIRNYIVKSTGAQAFEALKNRNTDAADVDDGDEFTQLYVIDVTSREAYNEGAAMNIAAREVADQIANLADTTFVSDEDATRNRPATANGDDYIDYTYTGEISDMVTVNNMTGQATYYVVYTVTQTCAVETFTR